MFYEIDAERANMPVKILWLVMGIAAAAVFFTLPEKNGAEQPTVQAEQNIIAEQPESDRMKSEIRRLQDEVRELKAQISHPEVAD